MVLFYGFWVHFAAFHLAFCCISPCILVHIAMRFGAYCNAFWCKMRFNN